MWFGRKQPKIGATGPETAKNVSNLPKNQFQDPKVTNLLGPEFVTFPVPRYLLVSQSSIPALQAMYGNYHVGVLRQRLDHWKLQFGAKWPKNNLQVEICIFKCNFTLSYETPLFQPSGL